MMYSNGPSLPKFCIKLLEKLARLGIEGGKLTCGVGVWAFETGDCSDPWLWHWPPTFGWFRFDKLDKALRKFSGTPAPPRPRSPDDPLPEAPFGELNPGSKLFKRFSVVGLADFLFLESVSRGGLDATLWP